MLFWPSPAGSGVHVPGGDKIVHLGLFLVLSGTARLRFGPAPVVLVGVLVYALVSEAVQALLLPSRSGDVGDVGADAVGALLGWWLAGQERLRR